MKCQIAVKICAHHFGAVSHYYEYDANADNSIVDFDFKRKLQIQINVENTDYRFK